MKLVTKHFAAVALVLLLGADANPTARPTVHVPHEQLKKLGWQLAVPTATFTDRTVFESIDLLHSLNIHHLEIGPGQVMSADMPDIVIGHTMPQKAIDALLAKLKSVHMDIVSYGPVDLGSDNASAWSVFAFATQIKVKDVVVSGAVKFIESLHNLATQFGINLVIVGDKRKDGPVVQIRIAQVDPAAITELKTQGFKGVIVITCKPGSGEAEISRFILSVNELSDAIESASH